MKPFLWILAFTLLFFSNSCGQPVSISIAAGKQKYVVGEPIYLSIITEVKSNAKRLESIGISFCRTDTTGKKCSNNKSFNGFNLSSSEVGIPFWKNAQTEARRDIVSLGTYALENLIGKKPGTYSFQVVENMTQNGEELDISSNSVKVEIVPQTEDDSKLWAELSQIGVVELIDGPSCVIRFLKNS